MSCGTLHAVARLTSKEKTAALSEASTTKNDGDSDVCHLVARANLPNKCWLGTFSTLEQ